MEVAKSDRGEVRILTAGQSAALMQAAEGVPEMVPYFALGLFAGLRPTELRRLDWRAVEEDHIRIGAEVAKARSRRLVDVSPALAAWLDGRRRESGPIHYSRRSHRSIVAAAGIEWTADVLRHTFASMHLAAFGSPAATAFQLGHAGVAVLDSHYKALVTPEEAARFWAIRPAV
jgi:integrase